MKAQKAENIHIQRDPTRGKRGYHVRGWTPGSDRKIVHPPFNPAEDCAACQGKKYVLDEKVNKHRSHFMRYSACKVCGGNGRK